MTFLEALNWLNESEENVAVRLPDSPHHRRAQYRVNKNILEVMSPEKLWLNSSEMFNTLILSEWQKVELAPKAVEVVAYTSGNGDVCLCEAGSPQERYFVESEWRKVRVRFESEGKV